MSKIHKITGRIHVYSIIYLKLKKKTKKVKEKTKRKMRVSIEKLFSNSLCFNRFRMELLSLYFFSTKQNEQ